MGAKKQANESNRTEPLGDMGIMNTTGIPLGVNWRYLYTFTLFEYGNPI